MGETMFSTFRSATLTAIVAWLGLLGASGGRAADHIGEFNHTAACRFFGRRSARGSIRRTIRVHL
jgi:hypothetical protein